ncbi:MAG: OsmC family protein [Chitinophagaceae bacterium]
MTASVVYTKDLRTFCTHVQSGSTIETDAPTDNQGKGERFSPTDLLAVSLASCMLTTMAIKARDLEAALQKVRIDVEKIMSWNPRRVSKIILTFHYPEQFELSTERKSELEAIAWSCPVKESIHPDIDVQVNFNWPTT